MMGSYLAIKWNGVWIQHQHRWTWKIWWKKPVTKGQILYDSFYMIFPTQESNPGLQHSRQILYQLSYQGSMKWPEEVNLQRQKVDWWLFKARGNGRIEKRPVRGTGFFFKGNEMFWTWMWWNFPGGPVAKTLHSQCLKIPHPTTTTQCSQKKTKQNKQTNKKCLWHGCTTLWIYYTIELYTLNGWLAWCVNIYLNKTVERKKGLLGGSAVKTLHSQCRAQAQCLISSVQSLSLCNPMDCSLPGFPVLHCFTEFAQAHVHWVADAIQPSRPLSSPSPPIFNLSQHQSLFQWVSSLYWVAIGLELQLQHQSFQWIFMVDFL